MTVKLHPSQLEVANDTHRFRVICAGRRWGKSVLSELISIKWALDNPNGVIWIVSPTYRQGKQIHWKGLQQIIPRDWVLKKNEVELSITLKNGSIIELKGAENPDALRGVKLRGLVIDEIASIRNWDWLWSEVLRPTLTDYQAPCLFISTPKGYNHFFDLYNNGQTLDSDYKSWRFTSYDNPYIPSGEIDNAKKELTEDTFYQEYMADFRKYTGLVYKEFNRETHVIEPFEIDEGFQVFRSMDFGSQNPTVCLWIATDRDDNWFIVDEYYQGQQADPDYHAGRINANNLNQRVSQSWCDPNNSLLYVEDYNKRGIYLTPASKEGGTAVSWVRFGIEKVAEKLKIVPGKKPALHVFSTCTNTLREFESYRWKEKSVTQAQDLNEPDVPEKANDHAMDALRYFAVSYQKMPEMPKQNFNSWRIGD